jgi:hypothetical protein
MRDPLERIKAFHPDSLSKQTRDEVEARKEMFPSLSKPLSYRVLDVSKTKTVEMSFWGGPYLEKSLEFEVPSQANKLVVRQTRGRV